MLDRPETGERAVLVHVAFRADTAEAEELQSEFRELTRSAGVELVGEISASRDTPDPRYFVGSGKVEEISETVAGVDADVVLFNRDLSPAQERNLEQRLQCRVLDRTEVILDIFAQRASTFEGKLQVELAQLQHLSTRLVRGWTHLERQKGGIGLRGPGETQLETDRRLLGERIKQIHKRLERVRKQRGQGRRARRRAELGAVSLVGYTNAGKSTLFNALTGAEVYQADKLFATLDPTLRRIDAPGLGPLVLADTVGFVRDLPHDLVAAFRATLEETREADLLLHVIDATSPLRQERIEQVNGVLAEIGAAEVPRIEVYNKIDRLGGGERPRLDRDAGGRVRQIWLSARTGEGLDLLLEAIAEHFADGRVRRWVRVPMAAARLRARLYDLKAVRRETVDASGDWMIEVEMDRRRLEALCSRAGLEPRSVAATQSGP